LGGLNRPPIDKGNVMAQYWYKKDKRVKRIPDQGDDRNVIQRIKDLKAKGYVKVLDRRNPADTIVKQPKRVSKPRKKTKTRAKKK